MNETKLVLEIDLLKRDLYIENHLAQIKINTLSRDGPDIRSSIRYPAKSGHFSAIWYRILKNRILGFRISGRISGKPDISNTFLHLFEDLRLFNYLSNYVEQRTGIEISGIRPDIRYPVFRMAGYSVGRISGKTAIRSIPTVNRFINSPFLYQFVVLRRIGDSLHHTVCLYVTRSGYHSKLIHRLSKFILSLLTNI